MPISITPGLRGSSLKKDGDHWDIKCLDEQADSMARKCIK